MKKINNEENDKKLDDDSQITLIDEDGNEELYNVLFTFDSEDYKKSYVLLYPSNVSENEDIEVQAFSFKSNDNGIVASGDLYPIENDEEWNMVEEVLNTFLNDDKINNNIKNNN